MVSPTTSRRFPRPWSVGHNDDCFWVEDASGQKLAFVYFRDEQTIGSGRGYLPRDGARRIAANIAKLPELIDRARQKAGTNVR